ncbi:MAG: hypothetical protein WBZ50_07485 [Nitrososphaeraceae archaeon]
MSTPELLRKRLQKNWFDFLRLNSTKFSSNIISGASPPSLFVGNHGYPKIRIGPLVPPLHGNTAILDSPESWSGKSIDQIVNYRMNLVRGVATCDANSVSGSYINSLQEIAMSAVPVESTATFVKRPMASRDIFSKSNETPSMLTAQISNFKTYATKTEPKIEKVYYDTDMPSNDAMMDLYNNGVSISQISKVLSVGMIGRKSARKLVPTKWSISATDQTISANLIRIIQDYQPWDQYGVFTYSHLGNRYSIILIPDPIWSFEMVEAWFDTNGTIVFGSDYEDARGLSHYPTIAGAYFAARLGVTEYLKRTNQLASVLVFREIQPEYVLPVGVWQIREGIRMALRSKPVILPNLESSMSNGIKSGSVSLTEWARNSRILKERRKQRRISDFCVEQ